MRACVRAPQLLIGEIANVVVQCDQQRHGRSATLFGGAFSSSVIGRLAAGKSFGGSIGGGFTRLSEGQRGERTQADRNQGNAFQRGHGKSPEANNQIELELVAENAGRRHLFREFVVDVIGREVGSCGRELFSVKRSGNQTATTSSSGSTSCFSIPSIAINVPVSELGQLPQAP